MATASARHSAPRTRVLRVGDDGARERADRLAGEEPMEIRAAGPGQEPVRVAVTMRTPGHDFELAAGFLFTEGLIESSSEVASVAYCTDVGEEQRYNVVTVALARPFELGRAERAFYATSSCGICGKASLESVEVRCGTLGEGPGVARSTLLALPVTLREKQRIFATTGGLHAAGLFDESGTLLGLREDVGRHNALDKLVGRALLAGEVPLANRVLLVSGRLSFEIVQKAAVAGIALVCAVSAPSSLAVDAAARLGMTLVGFLRGQSFNIYSHPGRIDVGS